MELQESQENWPFEVLNLLLQTTIIHIDKEESHFGSLID